MASQVPPRRFSPARQTLTCGRVLVSAALLCVQLSTPRPKPGDYWTILDVDNLPKSLMPLSVWVSCSLPEASTFQLPISGLSFISISVWSTLILMIFVSKSGFVHLFVRDLLGTDPLDLTLESTLPSPPQGSMRHRFDINSTLIRPIS